MTMLHDFDRGRDRNPDKQKSPSSERVQDERDSVVPPDFAQAASLRLIGDNGAGRPAISCRDLGRGWHRRLGLPRSDRQLSGTPGRRALFFVVDCA